MHYGENAGQLLRGMDEMQDIYAMKWIRACGSLRKSGVVFLTAGNRLIIGTIGSYGNEDDAG